MAENRGIMQRGSQVIIKISLIFLVSTSSILVGCVKQAPMNNGQLEPTSSQLEPIRHTIKYQGETYALIARWYTGDTRNWKAIADANPAVLPTRMRLGDVVLIPRVFVKQDKPLPKDLVTKSTAIVPVTTESIADGVSASQSEQSATVAPQAISEGQQAPVVPQPEVKPSAVVAPVPPQPVNKGALLEEEDPGDNKIQQPTPTAKPVEAVSPSQTIGQPNNEEDANKAKLLNELLD